jgi:hypothetical protein
MRMVLRRITPFRISSVADCVPYEHHDEKIAVEKVTLCVKSEESTADV